KYSSEKVPIDSDDQKGWKHTSGAPFHHADTGLLDETKTMENPFPVHRSEAKETWKHIKASYGVESEAMDSIMEMLGIEDAKARVVEIAFTVALAKAKKGLKPSTEELNVVFTGNPGVGKKTIAKHYVKFLQDVNVSQSPIAQLAGRAYDNADSFGYTVRMETDQGSVSIIVGNSQDNLQGLCEAKARRERITSISIHLQDFTEHELYEVFVQELSKKFGGTVQVKGSAINGLATKVLMRRLAKGRGTSEFSNFRLMENIIPTIIRRQYVRLLGEFKTSKDFDARILTQEDLLGPPPSRVLEDNESWKKLDAMIGMESVKTAIKSLFYQLQWNYDRELAELPLVKTSLNKLFLGNPGTGKTTVAKLYAQLLCDAGLLSSSEILVKTPADFVGPYTGQSERLTKQILREAKGKVLIIDEAYMLNNRGDHEKTDSFRTGVIDTLVGEIQGGDNEDRCVLLLGYRQKMEDMFRDTNPGLAHRFPMSSAFVFEDYTKEELRQILELKLAKDGLKASSDTKQVAMDVLERSRNSVLFANAGEIDTLLTRAKERQRTRLANLETQTVESIQILEPGDMDEDFDRIDRAAADIKELFSGMVCVKSLVEKLEGWQKVVKAAKGVNFGEPRDFIPFNFIFRGPPGTGKTTTARKMGKVFYNLGFLATTEIVECSASDLIGQCVGQTGPQTRKVFEKALGKVLFIDEAYRLASKSDNSYASEAVAEIVDLLTQDKFRNKLVVILAGYDAEINRLLATNPGLNSRFPETIEFENLAPRDCRDLLFNSLKPRRYFEMENMAKWQTIDKGFVELASLPFWGNARDVQTLVNNVMSTVLKGGMEDHFHVSREITKMLVERRKRAEYTI
ncbi:ATPases of the AAA+ class, partial [Annulohypoxylon bovei var. microspora]